MNLYTGLKFTVSGFFGTSFTCVLGDKVQRKTNKIPSGEPFWEYRDGASKFFIRETDLLESIDADHWVLQFEKGMKFFSDIAKKVYELDNQDGVYWTCLVDGVKSKNMPSTEMQ